ncbi:hypothetical protein P43SY_008145 [Pythium insidiosum]|uniref:Uncharacterized protein n=1 Tax=Pythium insidiosum TaxID=114742 RepID=A0AAD5LFR1_PYTIN|nr:hypothetical protein P43SY_008145 [Pythium insidiosum]
MTQKQSPSRMMIMLPLLFLMNKVDFENPMILNSARVAFFVCQIVSLLTYLYIKKKVEEKNDQRKILIPGISSPFDPNPNYSQMTETTYAAHELAKVNEFIKQTLIGAVIAMVIHFKMGVNHVVLIQSVMTPLNLYDNVLVQAFIFGKRDGRIWNEKFEGEPLEAAPTDGEDKQAGDKKEKTKKAAKKTVSASEAISQAFDAGVDADFDGLWNAIKGDVNAKTSESGWTALMVACGSPVDTDDFIRKVVAAGADATAADDEGWTALHWSAFHGRPEAAEALLEALSPSKRELLLTKKASDGKTALEVAQGEDNADVVEVIEKFSGSAKTSSDDETELRRRKPATNASTTTTSVDDVD